MTILKQFQWMYEELGLHSLYDTGADAWLIIGARSCRMIAFGTVSLILALFFAALEVSDTYIGIFMTLTLAGEVILGLLLTMVADRIGRRRVLLGGSVMMVLSGAVFAYFENYWILLVAAVVGVVSATGGDFGPFRAIEESILSGITDQKSRPDVLAWYVTAATLGQTVGTEAGGRIVHFLEHLSGWTHLDAFHTIFWIYSAVGILNIMFVLLLSDRCEIAKEKKVASEESDAFLGENNDEMEERDSGSLDQTPKPEIAPNKKGFFASIGADTRSVMYKLWFLLIIDSLADGMTPYSLTTYYIDLKFKLRHSTLGDITSISYFLSFLSTLFAAPLSRRIGLVNTMVFTHLPSSLAVLAFPFASSVWLTVALLMLRTGLNNMDQAPRSALIAAVVRPEERTSVMGITSMVRTMAATLGPTVTGLLAGNKRFWIAFVAAGVLRCIYDLGLWAIFISVRLDRHEKVESVDQVPMRQVSRESDEEDLAGVLPVNAAKP